MSDFLINMQYMQGSNIELVNETELNILLYIASKQ